MTRFIGLDTGRKNIGFGVVEPQGGGKLSLVEAGMYQPDTPEKNMGGRMYELAQWAMALMQRHQPGGVGYERVFFPPQAVQNQERMAFHTGAMMAVMGYVPVVGFTPQQIKSRVTGYSKANKDAVARGVAMMLNADQQEMSSWADHVTDAIAAAILTADDMVQQQKLDQAKGV